MNAVCEGNLNLPQVQVDVTGQDTTYLKVEKDDFLIQECDALVIWGVRISDDLCMGMIKPCWKIWGMCCCFTGQMDHGTGGVQFVQYTAVTVIPVLYKSSNGMRGRASYKISLVPRPLFAEREIL